MTVQRIRAPMVHGLCRVSLDEIISLFVDINQYGEKVKRFDIVKAMSRRNPLLRSVWNLIAEQQQRQKDIFYRQKRTPFTRVLKNLQIVENLAEPNAQVDRIWERLLEIALFQRTRRHMPPTQVLKGFISGASDTDKLTAAEVRGLRKVFAFLAAAYSDSALSAARLTKDQTHFYTMVTSIIDSNLIEKYGDDDLKKRLTKLASVLDSPKDLDRKTARTLQHYTSESKTQTTHIGRRSTRQLLFLQLVDAM